jgi:hypothetical protein
MPDRIDLTPTEPVLYDGESVFYPEMEAEARRLRYDPRDFPQVKRGIRVLRETRIQTPPDKKSFTCLDKDGKKIHGAYPLRRLVQELVAQIEEEAGPTQEQVVATKAAGGGYQL